MSCHVTNFLVQLFDPACCFQKESKSLDQKWGPSCRRPDAGADAEADAHVDADADAELHAVRSLLGTRCYLLSVVWCMLDAICIHKYVDDG